MPGRNNSESLSPSILISKLADYIGRKLVLAVNPEGLMMKDSAGVVRPYVQGEGDALLVYHREAAANSPEREKEVARADKIVGDINRTLYKLGSSAVLVRDMLPNGALTFNVEGLLSRPEELANLVQFLGRRRFLRAAGGAAGTTAGALAEGDAIRRLGNQPFTKADAVALPIEATGGALLLVAGPLAIAHSGIGPRGNTEEGWQRFVTNVAGQLERGNSR